MALFLLVDRVHARPRLAYCGFQKVEQVIIELNRFAESPWRSAMPCSGRV
jgi:hypothetical protein